LFHWSLSAAMVANMSSSSCASKWVERNQSRQDEFPWLSAYRHWYSQRLCMETQAVASLLGGKNHVFRLHRICHCLKNFASILGNCLEVGKAGHGIVDESTAIDTKNKAVTNRVVPEALAAHKVNLRQGYDCVGHCQPTLGPFRTITVSTDDNASTSQDDDDAWMHSSTCQARHRSNGMGRITIPASLGFRV
jgi:hypothetical protein